MKTFKQFLNEMTADELHLSLFFKSVMGIRKNEAKEAVEWYYKRLDLDNAKTDVKNSLFTYFEDQDEDLSSYSKVDSNRILWDSVNDEFQEWLEDNGLDDDE